MKGFSHNRPFVVIPWQQDFLSGLLDLALEETQGDIGKADFVFPHSRPRRYLSLLLQQHPHIERPVLMPGMFTISSLFASASASIASRPAWTAGLLDRVGLLLAAVRAETGRGNPFLDDAKTFFPWGVRLAALFEECFTQGKTGIDFMHVEEEVSPFAALLLENLSGIFTRYEAAIKERGWTTPGLDAFVTARYLQTADLPDGVLPHAPDRTLFICGFHALTGTEQALFRYLWQERGALVVVHADEAIINNADPHWSCRAFSAWAKSWNTTLAPARSNTQSTQPGTQLPLPFSESLTPEEPKIRYVSGFDLHSQLVTLQEELHLDSSNPPGACADSPGEREEPDAILQNRLLDDDESAFAELEQPGLDHQADTAIILPESGLLLPVLHHLPRVDVNISMGYPLSRSPLFRLIDTILRLQEGKKGTRYYWRDLVDLLRHPYIKMLSATSTLQGGETPPPSAVEAAGLSLRGELHRLEQLLRESGKKYVDPRDFTCPSGASQSLPDPAARFSLQIENAGQTAPSLLESVFTIALDAFAELERPVDLSEALENLCSFLLRSGRALWKRFPIDSECLHRLRQSLIPELARSELSFERFDGGTLFTLLRNLMQAERVPFEAVPLVGLQVMGMLETRLLSFRRVIVLDAVEESLPGSPDGDPLLPEALRPELGLSPLHSREQVAAYNFFRLIAGAKECLLLWQENSDAPGIQNQKKRKSRFVEELLWKEELKRGKLFASQGVDGPLTVLESKAAPLVRKEATIAITPAIRQLTDSLLERPVSASFLDTYLRCPARFYYERVAGLMPASEVQEGDDPAAVGNLLHAVLHTFYAKHADRRLPGKEELKSRYNDELLNDFFSSPDYADLVAGLPADSRAMLNAAAEKRLADYLANQPETRVLAMEKKLTASFEYAGRAWKLTGNFDRIDRRPLSCPVDADDDITDLPEEGIVILDYKTGRVPKISSSLWDDDLLWQSMELWSPLPADCPGPDSLLQRISKNMESVQLPFYLLLYTLALQGAKPTAGLQEDMARIAGDAQGNPLPAMDALWVTLGEQGKELSLFPQKFSWSRRRDIIENSIPKLVFFLLTHIKTSTSFHPCPGIHCRWCKSEKLCMVSHAD